MIPLYDLKLNNNIIRDLTIEERATDAEKSKNLNLLAGADSIHDFKPPSSNDEGRVPAYTWDTVKNSLLVNLNSLSKTSNNLRRDIKSWTQYMSDNEVTPGTIEDKTVSYFEKKYPEYLMGKTVILTYRTVINSIKSASQRMEINEAIWATNQQLCENADILEIDMAPGENWDTSYSQPDKVFIGLFLLNFYFPPIDPTTKATTDVAYNTKIPTYITFDAGSNIPSKIFGLLNQVINLVTPLNIADSATTGSHLVVEKSQKRAGVKNKYVFPVNNGTTQYNYKSNIFTMSNNVNLFTVKPDGEYDETNKYNFNIFFQQDNTNACIFIPFTKTDENGTKTYSAGPGVGYLSEFMQYKSNNSSPIPQPSTGSIAPININCPTVNIPNNALYFDLKRAGDWEQCLAALTVNKLMTVNAQSNRVVLCTIDRLCALFSRCIGQNALYHYGTQLTLFRYNANAMTELEKQEQIRVRQIAEAAEGADAAIAIDAITAAFNTVNINKILISNVSINGFKPKTKGLNTYILNIAKLLMLSSITQYMVIYYTYNVTKDHKQFFSSIRELSGLYITPKNIAPFIDTINIYVRAINDGNIILPKGTFCYYDSQILINLYDILQRILIFTARTKSIALVNYKSALEENNLFTALQNIANNMEIIRQESSKLLQFAQQQQPQQPQQPQQIQQIQQEIQQQIQTVDNFNGFVKTMSDTKYREQPDNNDYTEPNVEYYTTLKSIIDIAIATTNSTRGGFKQTIQTGGDIDESQKQTVIDNLYKSLTTEFISLSVLLNELTANLVSNGSMDFDTLYNGIIINPSDTTNRFAFSYTKDILLLLQDFFENSWYFIQQAENELDVDININLEALKRPVKQGINLEGLRTDRLNNQEIGRKEKRKGVFDKKRFEGGSAINELFNIKRLYYTLYLFFACLYEDIPNDQLNMINTIKSGIWNNPTEVNEYIYNSLLKNNIFFNNYIASSPELGIIYSDDIKAANLKIIIKYCLKIRFEKPYQINNYVLFIFTFFVNYLKFYVKKAAVRYAGENTNVTTLSNYGYYPGIINDFTDSRKIINLFNKINTVTTAATGFTPQASETLSFIDDNINSIVSETVKHETIFKQIDIIIKALLMYTVDPPQAIMNLNISQSLSKSSGGKRTRRKQIIRRKTMKRGKAIRRRKTMKKK